MGGTFYGKVIEGGATIKEGAYRNIVFDTDGGSFVDTQKMLKGPTGLSPISGGWAVA